MTTIFFLYTPRMRRASILFIVTSAKSMTINGQYVEGSSRTSVDIVQRDQADGYASYQFEGSDSTLRYDACGSFEANLIICGQFLIDLDVSKWKTCELINSKRVTDHINILSEETEVDLGKRGNFKRTEDLTHGLLDTTSFPASSINLTSAGGKSTCSQRAPKLKQKLFDATDAVAHTFIYHDLLSKGVDLFFRQFREQLDECKSKEQLEIGCYALVKNLLSQISQTFQGFNGSAVSAEKIAKYLEVLFEQMSYMDLEATEMCLRTPEVVEACSSFSVERFNQDVDQLSASVNNLWTDVLHYSGCRAVYKAKGSALRARLSMLELIEMSQLSKKLDIEKVDTTLSEIFTTLDTIEKLLQTN